MKCPECGSENIKRLEVIYDEGTSNQSGLALLVGTGGEGAAVTAGRSKTQLAQKCSPPKKKGYESLILAILLAVLCFCLMEAGAWLWFFLPAVGVIFSIFLATKTWEFNKTSWPKLYDSWLKSWCCLKCGCFFQIDENGKSLVGKNKTIVNNSGGLKYFFYGFISGLFK